MAITLGQFQEIFKVQKAEMEEEEKITEMVSIVSGKSVSELDDMPKLEFDKLARSVTEILKYPIPDAKPQPKIAGYTICYEPAKLKRGQYVTLMEFMKGDVVENAHLIMASLIVEDVNHPEAAEKMQDVSLNDIYPSCLFFCELYRASIHSLRSFLVKEMLKKKIPLKQSQKTIQDLMNVLDGYTMPSEWQTLRASA